MTEIWRNEKSRGAKDAAAAKAAFFCHQFFCQEHGVHGQVWFKTLRRK
jgi:hypothetical protein